VSSPERFPVRVSVQAFGIEPTAYADVAVRAEEQGFDTLWLADHVVTPLRRETAYPYSANGDPGYGPETPLVDVLVAAGNAAALTTRLRLGTGVLILPLRNPLLAARAIATVQALSRGRLLLGVGAGWLREEFDALGESFERRGARLEEMIGILRTLWTGAPVRHDGSFYRFDPVQLSPPVDAPPVFMGGTTHTALRRAARAADGWYGPACDLDASLEARRRIELLREEQSRQGPFEYAVRLDGRLAPETVERYAEAGFDHVVVPLGRAGADAGGVDRLAEQLAG
jgi:probable F420-dependent oxidoreductase